jgi:hypothetical protein
MLPRGLGEGPDLATETLLCVPRACRVDAALVASLPDMPEADVTRLCDGLDVAGYLTSAPEPMN